MLQAIDVVSNIAVIFSCGIFFKLRNNGKLALKKQGQSCCITVQFQKGYCELILKKYLSSNGVQVRKKMTT
jgi:hypothetical protein